MAGWVEKRGENTWRLNVPGGTDAEGKRKTYRKVVEATSKREAEKLLDLFSAEVQKGQYVEPSKLTFKAFVQRWLAISEPNLAPKTLFRYRQLFESRIIPALGHLKVEEIKPVHLLEFYKNLAEDGIRLDGRPGKLSDSTVHHHHRVISAIFQDAVEWQVIPYNPASRVKPPKVKKKQTACYDERQTFLLLEALEKEPLKYRTAITLTLAAGLRQGELMGLDWPDIDFENNTITISKASQYLPGKGVFEKDPKNETSKRTISVPASVMSLLKEYRKEWLENRLKAGDLWQGSEKLFVTWDGHPMYPGTITHWFDKFQKRHGLSHITFHALRHTSASIIISQGAPLKNVSSRLGHSNISTTADIYGHAFKSVDREIADKLDTLFNGKTKAGMKNPL